MIRHRHLAPAAYAAIPAMLPSSVGIDQERRGQWRLFIWLDHASSPCSAGCAAPGECYSDVILWLAKAGPLRKEFEHKGHADPRDHRQRERGRHCADDQCTCSAPLMPPYCLPRLEPAPFG